MAASAKARAAVRRHLLGPLSPRSSSPDPANRVWIVPERRDVDVSPTLIRALRVDSGCAGWQCTPVK